MRRNLQVEDTKKLFNLIQENNLKDPFVRETIYNFTKEYSSIASERILNYHLNDCIMKFITTIESPDVIKDSQKVIDAFSNQFGFTDDKSIKKLIEKINWDTRELDITTINLLSKNLLEHFKPLIIEKASDKVSKIIEKRGISSFDTITVNNEIALIGSQIASIISENEFKVILVEQYTIFMSMNIYQVVQEDTELLESIKSLLMSNSNELIMKSMIDSIKNGLFNIGNSTEEIIFIFKELIPLIRELDPSGYVLDCCLKEAQTYFKHFRKDLNTALLNFLLKHKNSDFLLKEFEEQKGKNNPFALEYPSPSRFNDWKPDPIYIKTFINPEIRTADPINLLISHLSVNDSLSENYQKKIAEKLLRIENLEEVETIVEEVEVLRKKCGDSFVTSLNIMINDVIESKGKCVESDLKVTIISHRYWPEFEEKELEHPEMISDKLKIISSAYSRQYEDKKIIWRPQMDEVKLSLEFPSGTVLFTCPVEAAILINSFDFPLNSEDEEFDISMTVALTGISDRNLLKKAIRFWLKKRVIVRSKSKFNFRFVQDYDPNEPDCVDSHLTLFDSKEAEIYADDDESSDSDSTIFQEKYWPIISNMFKTFGQISAERIQSTLKMYSKEYKEPLDLLIKFLQGRVREGILQSHGIRIILYSLTNK